MSYIHQQHQHQDNSIAQAQQVPTYEIQMKPTNNSLDGDGGGGGAIRQAQIIRQASLQQHEHIQEDEAGVMVEEHDVTASSMNNNDESYGNNGDNDSDARMNNTNDNHHDITAGSSEMHGGATNNDSLEDDDIALHAGFQIKPDGKSNKYPSLKRYYEFGPWVGRNRKAICVRCKHTSASSQPERLIKHLRRCTALTEEEKAIAEDLLLVSNANKKKRPIRVKTGGAGGEDDDTDYYADDDPGKSFGGEQSSTISLPSSGIKRLRRDHPDRKIHIDQALVRFIVCCRIPLRSIHSKEFVEFVRSLDPDYRIPSRETITNVLIPRVLNIL